MDASTQTPDRPNCTTGKYPKRKGICRWRRSKKNVDQCICGDEYCRCCPNGCWFKTMAAAYPNLTHDPKFDHLCGVCNRCKDVTAGENGRVNV